jgi:hypothetical protein
MFEKRITLKPSHRPRPEISMSFLKSAANDLNEVLKHPGRLVIFGGFCVAGALQMKAGEFSNAALICAFGATVLTFLKVRTELRGRVAEGKAAD